MKRTTFAWGLVGCLVLVSSAKAEEPGVVVLDRVGPATYTARGQSAGDHDHAPPAAPPSSDHGHHSGHEHSEHGHHEMSMHGMPMYGMPMHGEMMYDGMHGGMMHGYGDWTMSPGCSTGAMHCCSDEGWKPTGNAILDAPVELTTAIFKGLFCHCGGCSRCCPNGRNPSGCGRYKFNYPVNPTYFDQRDGQVYSAEGYGAPMAVPLAPCVRQSYNYSWGIPSSRITPLSRMPGQGGY